MLSETLMKGTLTAATREIELDYQKKSYQYSLFGFFGPSSFNCKEPKSMFSNQVNFYE